MMSLCYYYMTWQFSDAPCDHCPLFLAEAPYNETPSSYGYDLERSEEHRPRHDPLSFAGSPSSSPRLRSKSRSSRDTQSSGSLESTLSVMLLGLAVTLSLGWQWLLYLPPGCCAPVPGLLRRPSLSSLHAPSNTFSGSRSVMKFAITASAVASFTVSVLFYKTKANQFDCLM